MLKSLAKNTQVRRLLEIFFKGFANELEVHSAFISHYCLSLTFVFSLL